MSPRGRATVLCWFVLACFLYAATGARTGLHHLDTDDAMRMVQVRDWLAGQAWFDTTQHRGAPAPGFSMHWSRLPDLGPAALVLLFRPFVADPETLAMIVWPPLLLLPALWLVGRIADALAPLPNPPPENGGRGPGRAGVPAMVLFGTVGPAMWQFKPGRIDHHNLQIVGLLAMLACLVGSRRSAAIAGLAGAFTLAIGLEALPYWLVLCAAVGTLLVIEGDRDRTLAFGLATALATPLFAFAFNPPQYVLGNTCDQVALPVLGLAVVGGAGLAAAAVAVSTRSVPVRLAAVAGVGVAAMGTLVWLGPDCLAGPYARMDPTVRELLIGQVNEARPLLPMLLRREGFAISIATTLVLGMGGLVVALRRTPLPIFPPGGGGDGGREKAAIVGAVFLAASALVLVQVRAVPYAAALACPLIAAALAHVRYRAVATGIAIALPFLARPLLAVPTPTLSSACYDPAAFAPLADLPPGLSAAPIDNGPFILMTSALSVLSAPYHRNGAGILAAHDLLAGPFDREPPAGVDYVIVCPTGESLALPPESLGARLSKGEAPGWLRPVVSQTASGLVAYAVTR